MWLLIALLVSGPASALRLGKETAEPRLVKEKGRALRLELWMDGKLLQTIPGLGTRPVPLLFDGKELELAGLDLDGDGFEELFLRTASPPLSGALWLLRWDRGRRRLDYVRDENGDRSVPVPVQGSVELKRDGGFSFGEGAAVRRFAWDGRHHVRK